MGKNKNSAKSLDTNIGVYVVGRISLVEESISVELDSVNSPAGRAILRRFVRGLRRRKSTAKVVRKDRAAVRCGVDTGGRA